MAASLSQVIDRARFETIEANLTLALNDLKRQIGENPFLTEFTVYPGSPSAAIAREVAYRFTSDGVDATVSNTIAGTYYLIVKRDLPVNLVHDGSAPAAVEVATPVAAPVTPEEPKRQTTRVVVKTVKK